MRVGSGGTKKGRRLGTKAVRVCKERGYAAVRGGMHGERGSSIRNGCGVITQDAAGSINLAVVR